MSPTDDSVAGKGGQFMTTRWSAILLSAQSQASGSDHAREEFCQHYWYRLYAFIRRRGYNTDDAKDLIQGFFLFIFDHKALQRARPTKGKFRSFLLGSLKNYLLLIHRFRKRYSEILREAVAQTVTDSSEIDDEIRSLCEALIASEGRLRP